MWIRLSYGFSDQFGYYDRYCCIITMNMFIVIFLYLCKCICIFFVPLINLMRYFVIFVMFSIIKHISYHVMVHDWNKNILSYLILSYLILSYLILSYLILSYLILSYLILSYLILSYLILSYLILSYLIETLHRMT